MKILITLLLRMPIENSKCASVAVAYQIQMIVNHYEI